MSKYFILFYHNFQQNNYSVIYYPYHADPLEGCAFSSDINWKSIIIYSDDPVADHLDDGDDVGDDNHHPPQDDDPDFEDPVINTSKPANNKTKEI